MNSWNFGISAFALTAIASVACGIPKAHAVSMQVVPYSIHQNGFTAGIFLGHTVLASTGMNRLNAGGTFEARCPSTYLYPIPGSRGLPAESLFGGTQLAVTIPTVVPTLMDMPGFDSLPAGTSLTCNYNWTALAEEGTFTIGIGGVGFTIGGEKINDFGTVPFPFLKPAEGDGSTKQGCIR